MRKPRHTGSEMQSRVASDTLIRTQHPTAQQMFRSITLAECRDRFHSKSIKNKTYHIVLNRTLTNAICTHRAPKKDVHVLCQLLGGKSCFMIQCGSLKRRS